MASALEKLFFTITLLDKVSGPSKGVCNSFRRMQQQGKDAFQLMGKGALGLTTAAVGLNAFTGPARDFNQALREVASLGTAPEELARLEKASKQFAMQFGGDAAEIVRSAYDIQSAIPGLAKGALAAFTYQGALLAKATKATSGQITEYQGQMYNIFKADAQKMGDAKWIESLTGKTAKAVEMFMTTGPKMKQAFSNLGSVGQLMGVSMDEQIAVLGSLQSAGMSDANAGTAYKSMLSKMFQASETLGLNFKGANGNLLPMNRIIDDIQRKIGNLDKDKQVALLSKAFGEDGAKAVMNMMGKTGDLKKAIEDISKIQNADPALAMANKMVDPYQKFQATLNVLRITLGQGVLPALDLCLNVISAVLGVVVWLVDTIPGLKYVLGGIIIAVTALTMALSAFYLVIGARKVVSAFVGELRILWAWCLRNSAATHSMTFAQRLNAVMQMFWLKSIGRTIVGAKLAAAAQWLWNTSLRSGIFWKKMAALYSTLLAVATGRMSVQSALATVTTTGLTLATVRHTVVEKLHVLWLGLGKAALIAYQVAAFAVKLTLAAGVVPAVIASAAALGVYKTVSLIAAAASWVLSGGFTAAATATWAFAAALWATGIPEIVIAITLLVAALVAVC